MQAALQVIEPHINLAGETVNEQVRRRLGNAIEHLETALTLWRQHLQERANGLSMSWAETRRRSNEYLRHCRREWKSAVRMLRRAQLAV